MTITTEEQAVVDAVANLDANHQKQVAGLFGAKFFDIALLSGSADREKLRAWVESEINAASGTSVPPGVADLRGAVRRLRVASGDTADA